MNASGRPNTCKTNGRGVAIQLESVVRVRNTYATYPVQEYSSPKGELTLHNISRGHLIEIKTEVVQDGHASD
jgi:hypothetical protein